MVNSDWTFLECVKNIQALKSQFYEVLASFSYLEMKEVVKYKRSVRDSFYRLKFEEWKIDRLWEYMNGFVEYADLIAIVRVKNRHK